MRNSATFSSRPRALVADDDAAFRLLMEIVGPRAYLQRGSVDDVLAGRMETLYRSLLILTFGGGTNEIQRDLIGMFGLGLPRALRA